MTDPWSERILQAVEAALRKISKADGYYHTLASVQRYDRTRTPDARPSAEIAKTGETKTLRGPGMGDQWNADVFVEIEGVINPEDEDSLLTTDEQVSHLQDDIELALDNLVDWEALQAKVVRMEFANFGIESSEETIDGLEVRITISYAHAEKDTRAPLAPY